MENLFGFNNAESRSIIGSCKMPCDMVFWTETLYISVQAMRAYTPSAVTLHNSSMTILNPFEVPEASCVIANAYHSPPG